MSASRPTKGPLRPHDTSLRYLADRDGNAVYLAGSHTWATIQEAGITDPPAPFDWPGFLQFLVDHDHNFTRLWMWEHPKWGSWWPGDYFIEPMPWARTGPNLASDNKPRFDLTLFEEEFFERLRERVGHAQASGIYVSVMLFQGWSSCQKPFEPQGINPWYSHPFRAQNNINDIDGSSPDGEGRDWVHTLRSPEVTRLLESYVIKTIDTVREFDNVVFEIANECDGTDANLTWQYYMTDFVHEYEANSPGHRHPVLMTALWPSPRNELLFLGPAEVVSPSGWKSAGDETWDVDPPPMAARTVISDTDHLWGVGGSPDWVWKTFTRGHNALYMDPWGYDHMETRFAADEADRVRNALRQTRRLAKTLDLATMQPAPTLSSTRYVLKGPGPEYVVYQPDAGHFRFDLSDASGVLQLDWWDLTDGPFSSTSVTGGSPVRLAPPDRRPVVAHLRRPK